MIVKVRYFGRLAMELGMYSESLEIPEDMTVRDFEKFIKEKHPMLKNEELEISVDGKYAPPDAKIMGDVAIYPPISGG